MPGLIHWRQGLEIRFSSGFQQTEIVSSLTVLDDSAKYLIGNAHTFYLPPNAEAVVAEDYLKRKGETEPKLLAIHGERGGTLVRMPNPDQLLVFPTTKQVTGIDELEVRVGYQTPTSFSPVTGQFDIRLDFSVYLDGYLSSLGIPHGSESNTGKTAGTDALFSCAGSGKSDSSYV